MPFDEANDEQIKMLKMINDLRKRFNEKKGRKNIDNKEKRKNLIENSDELYKFRNKIIDTVTKEKDNRSVDLEWIKYPLIFKELEDEYNINPSLGIDIDDERSIDLRC